MHPLRPNSRGKIKRHDIWYTELMGPVIEQQQEAFLNALDKRYTGCIFDIDGTLTVRGDEYIPVFLQPVLADLSMAVPMAVCTARRLQHAHEKLAPLFVHASDPVLCQANWMLICENGAVGYVFDPKRREYEECYRAEYPYPEELRKALFEHLNKKLQGKLGVSFMNVVSMVFRPPLEGVGREDLARRSREIALIIRQELLPFDPKGLLSVGDSGIGVNVFPANSDKERGILEFAKSIASRRGFRMSPEAREIVAVGDQPEPLGNDEQFLDGRYGTPFTVGNTHPENFLPLPVFDENGQVMKGPEATLSLLRRLHFRDDLALRSV